MLGKPGDKGRLELDAAPAVVGRREPRLRYGGWDPISVVNLEIVKLRPQPLRAGSGGRDAGPRPRAALLSMTRSGQTQTPPREPSRCVSKAAGPGNAGDQLSSPSTEGRRKCTSTGRTNFPPSADSNQPLQAEVREIPLTPQAEGREDFQVGE